MKKYRFIASLMLASMLLFIVSSCSEGEKKPDPTPSPTLSLTLSSPADVDSFGFGDTVKIKAVAKADNQFHGYEIIIKDKSNSAELFKVEEHAHGKQLDIDTFWINNVHHHTDAGLEVSAITDHSGNKITKKANLHCMP